MAIMPSFAYADMYITNYLDNSISIVTPEGNITNCSGTGLAPYGIKSNGTFMWIATAQGVTVADHFCHMINYSGIGVSSFEIEYFNGSMWTADAGSNSVTEFKPDGTHRICYGTGEFPQSLVSDGTYLWTGNEYSNSVSRLDYECNIQNFTGTGSMPFSMTYCNESVWTANVNDSTLTRIFPNGSMVNYTGICEAPNGLACDKDGVVWVACVGNISNMSDYPLKERQGEVPAGVVSKVFINGTVDNYSGTGLAPVLIAYDGVNMWTANSLDNSTTVIHPDGTMINYTGTGFEPNGIAFDYGSYENLTITTPPLVPFSSAQTGGGSSSPKKKEKIMPKEETPSTNSIFCSHLSVLYPFPKFLNYFIVTKEPCMKIVYC